MSNGMLDQMRRESLALVGLLLALIALGYNTWRNELSEQNQTVRSAGIEMLLKVGELQSIVYLAHFDQDMQAGSHTKGEIVVSTLRDLAMFMPESVQQRSGDLLQSWRANWDKLGEQDQEAVALVDTALNKLRRGVIVELKALE